MWSKELLEAGKRRLAGDTARAATTDEVKDLRREAGALKECVADPTLENRLLKKHDCGWGRTTHEVSGCCQSHANPSLHDGDRSLMFSAQAAI